MFFNATVAGLTLRAAMGRRRAFLFALPGLALIVFTALLAASRPGAREWPSHVLGLLGFTVVVPIVALIIGASVLGAEIDDGSIITLLATPVRRASVIMTKYLVAFGLTVLFAAVPMLIAAVFSGGGSRPPVQQVQHVAGGVVVGASTPGNLISTGTFVVAVFVGAIAASAIYNALFLLLSAATRWAVAVGMLYVLIWEGLLSNLVPGARLLSAGHYGLGIANAFLNDPGLQAGLGLATSVIMGTIVTVLALLLAVRLLTSFAIKGDPA